MDMKPFNLDDLLGKYQDAIDETEDVAKAETNESKVQVERAVEFDKPNAADKAIGVGMEKPVNLVPGDKYVADSGLMKSLKSQYGVPDSFSFDNNEMFYNMIRNITRREWILVTGPTGCGKTHLGKILADVMGYEFFAINLGDTSNPASKLLGHIAYDPDKGTHFVRSQFVEAIQAEKPTLIMLDEITRDRSQELQNILIPVLDDQKELILDEERPPETIKVSDNVFFFATANVGRQYIGATNTIDRAWLDRFTGGIYQMDYLPKDSEVDLVTRRTGIETDLAEHICVFAEKVRALANNEELSTSVSTRMTIAAAKAVGDGVKLADALVNVAMPYFDDEAEKATVVQIIEAM